MQRTVLFVFKDQEVEVHIQISDSKNFPPSILRSLLINRNRYVIQSNVCDEVFQSYINYFSHQILPGTPLNHLEEYELLNQELCVPSFSNLIQISKDTINQRLKALTALNDDSIFDKSDFEHFISENLDTFIINFPVQLLNAPIDALINILSYKNVNFTMYDRLYDLIRSHFSQNNDPDIWTLLPLIDGASLSSRNLSDSIENEESRFGYRPKYDISGLLGRMEELKVLNDRYTKIWKEAQLVAQRGDVESLRSFFVFTFCENGHTFVLRKSDFTAELVLTDEKKEEIDVPSFVRFNSIDYSVESIVCKEGCSCPVKSIIFSEDSNVKNIDLNKLDCPLLERLFVPPSVERLKMNGAKKKLNIFLSKKSRYLTYTNDGLLLGKSEPESEHFDILVFASRNLRKVEIPENIRRIGSYCFIHCRDLKSIVFHENSQLQSIGSHAFDSCLIESISIPQNTISIENNAFYWCRNLTSIHFHENSQLRSIGDNAFESSSIETINIPQHTTEIGAKAFINCDKLKKINFSENSELRSIGENCFESSAIETINIPRHVIEVKSSIFKKCLRLRTVEFDEKSELQKLGERVFESTPIDSFTITPNVEEIKEECFAGAFKLENIIVSPSNHHFVWLEKTLLLGKTDSNSDSFDTILFVRPDITHVVVPSYIKVIQKNSFSSCSNLQSVEFSPDNELCIIGEHAFSLTSIESITFPHLVTEIQSFAFSNCRSLRKVTFFEDSELKMIGDFAFSSTSVENITIPPHVSVIKAGTFASCDSLQKVQFFENSELETIEFDAFKMSSIASIQIPSNVKELKCGCFNGAMNLVNIILSPDNRTFTWFKNRFLLGFSSPDSKYFDTLIFARPNLVKVVIPQFIKRIESRCFYSCNQLQRVKFVDANNIDFIGNQAFPEHHVEFISNAEKDTQTIVSSVNIQNENKNYYAENENKNENDVNKHVNNSEHPVNDYLLHHENLHLEENENDNNNANVNKKKNIDEDQNENDNNNNANVNKNKNIDEDQNENDNNNNANVNKNKNIDEDQNENNNYKEDKSVNENLTDDEKDLEQLNIHNLGLNDVDKSPGSQTATKHQEGHVEAPLSLPSYTVRLWWDYTSKYGLAYILHNGTCGACFNDATRMVLDKNERYIQYFISSHSQMEVIDLVAVSNYQSSHESNNAHIINDNEYDVNFLKIVHNHSIMKKIQLIKHFAKELKLRLEDKTDSFVVNENDASFLLQSVHFESFPPLLHVKYWMKNSDGVLFRFANRDLQANFKDCTKMVMESQTKVIFYEDKNNSVIRLTFNDLVDNEKYREVKKKYKIIKEMSKHFV